MLCEDVRRRLMEFVDQELSAEEAEAIETHVSWCGDCAEQLGTVHSDIEAVDAAVRSAMEPVRPDPARRKEFVRKASTPRLIRIRPLLELVAAAALFAFSLSLLPSPSPVDRYRDTLAQTAQQELQNLAAFKTAGLLDDLVPLETAALEDALLAVRNPGALMIAPEWDPHPRDGVRRSASRRYLASLSRQELEHVIPSIQDDALNRYARVLLQATETAKPPSLEGKPHWSISLTQHGSRVTFEQWRNGAVRVTALEGTQKTQAVAADVFELMEKEPELCRRFGIVGEGRTIKVGLPFKSSVSIRRGIGRIVAQRDPHRVAEEIAAMRMDALLADLVRSQGDQAPMLVRQIQTSLAQVKREPRLDELKRRLGDDELKKVESLERLVDRILQLKAFCQQLP